MNAASCPICGDPGWGPMDCVQCSYQTKHQVAPLYLQPCSDLADCYRIIRPLGKGAFGLTYLAWDKAAEIRVAIKEFFPSGWMSRGTDRCRVVANSDSEQQAFAKGLESFLKEARLLARLRHPNLVRLTRVFETNGTAYYVMDYYEGETLAAYTARCGGKLGIAETLGIFDRLLDGLGEVHRHRIWHRDLKPENIYLTSDKIPILLDFGAARQVVIEYSQNLTEIGTPGYAPPEQYHRKGHQGPWTDIYGVAATLYKTLTGVVPADAYMRMHGDRLREPVELVPSTPSGLNRAILLALKLKHSERPQSTREFQLLLRSHMEADPVLCAGCFREPRSANPCSRCGWEAGQEKSELRLPLYALVGRRYQMGRTLGKPSSYGLVYLAWDQRLARRVAIKEFFPKDLVKRVAGESKPVLLDEMLGSSFEAGLSDFIREAQLLATLDHPQVVSVLDHLEDRGTAYLVMKYYEGETLEARLKKSGGRMSPTDAVELLLPVLDALIYVHEQGCFHGDLTPDNLYLARSPQGSEQPLILDFGAARRMTALRSNNLKAVLTNGYAAPEQYRGKELRGACSDLYAIGAILYRLVTGQLPPDAPARRHGEPLIEPKKLVRGLDERLNKAIMTALELEISKRPQRAADFWQTLASCQLPPKLVNEATVQVLSPEPLGSPEPAKVTEPAAPNAAYGTVQLSGAEARPAQDPAAKIPENDHLATTHILVRSKSLLQVGESWKLELPERQVLELKWIPPGSFHMGSPKDERDRLHNEVQHLVELTSGFWMGASAVTQAQYQALGRENPSGFRGPKRPVEMVGWEDAKGWCALLQAQIKQKDWLVRLPTEAEWEYACRAETVTPFNCGERLDATMANFNGRTPYSSSPAGKYRAQTIDVCSFPPNAWGLYDFHGNVWEWCEDWYGSYPNEAVKNPTGPVVGNAKVLRGGSWLNTGKDCRSASRLRLGPEKKDQGIGFRIVLAPV